MRTTKEACAILGVSRLTLVYHWAEPPSKKLPGKTGGMLWSDARIRDIAKRHGRQVTI
jgi:hypothetical protein